MATFYLPVELTSVQKKILTALVNLFSVYAFSTNEKSIKGEEIAREVGKNPGTIRNQMQSLKALRLVEGVPGPHGGYKPTAFTYEALDISQLDSPVEVPFYHNGALCSEISPLEITLTSINHPDLCRAKIRVLGPTRNINQHDLVKIGPTPLSKLILEGTVEAQDETHGILILEIKFMSAQPKSHTLK